jgi:hypothetical protein
MLVVNRVDSQKRAYAVTNYSTLKGFVITEILLYDPNDKSTGMGFYFQGVVIAIFTSESYNLFI